MSSKPPERFVVPLGRRTLANPAMPAVKSRPLFHLVADYHVCHPSHASLTSHTRRKNAMLSLERSDVGFVKPDRYLDGNRHAVVGEHKLLQCLVPQLVVAHGRDNESGSVGCRVLLSIDDDAAGVGERRGRL